MSMSGSKIREQVAHFLVDIHKYTDANDIGQAASVLKKVLEELTRE